MTSSRVSMLPLSTNFRIYFETIPTVIHLEILQRGEDWDHRNSLTPPCSIEIHVPNQESEWSCLCLSINTTSATRGAHQDHHNTI